MRLSEKFQKTVQWIFSGELKLNKQTSLAQPTVHIYYEVHQHLHLQERDDLYHQVLSDVIQELPISVAARPHLYRQTLPVKAYSVN